MLFKNNQVSTAATVFALYYVQVKSELFFLVVLLVANKQVCGAPPLCVHTLIQIKSKATYSSIHWLILQIWTKSKLPSLLAKA